MADNLTQQILDDLEKQRNAISKPSAPSPQSNQTEGLSLYDQINQGIAQESQDPSDVKSGLLHGIGSGFWHYGDSALLGLPGLAVKAATGSKPYDMMAGETEGLASVGGIIGEAAGFLTPIGIIGKGMRGIVGLASKAGTRSVIKKSAALAGKEAAGLKGLTSRGTEKAVKAGLTAKEVSGAGKAISKYELSLDKVNEVESSIRGSIFTQLKKQFPDAKPERLLQVTDSAVRGMKSEGVHINNLSSLIQKGLNTSLSLSDKNKITAYAGRAAEMTTSFGIYNLMHDGVHSMAGEQEFDPVSDVKDALVFSVFLPAVEMVGKGGQVHIRRQAYGLWKNLRNSKKLIEKADDLTQKEANGILNILSKGNYLGESKGAISSIAKEASKYTYKEQGHKEAIKAIKQIYKSINPEEMWKDFYKVAKDDFVASTGRMLLGAAYFNVGTLTDTHMLKNLPPEDIMTHLLVGAYFTKHKKPLFREEYPHLNGFSERAKALEYLGMDSKNFEHWSTAFNEDNNFAAAYTGILGNKQVTQIESIFEKFRPQQEKPNWEPPSSAVGEVENIRGNRLAILAHGLYQTAYLSRKLHETDGYDSHIKLENLTQEQLKEITTSLESIKISETENLSTKEFPEWQSGIVKESIKNNVTMHLETLIEIADKLEIRYDAVDGKIDIDNPINMAKIAEDGINISSEQYKEINLFNSLRNKMEDLGFIRDIPQSVGDKKQIKDVINDTGTKHFIKDKLSLLKDQLRVDNYGETYPKDNIDLLDNAFLHSFGQYKRNKKQDSLFNIVENLQSKFSEKDLLLHNILQETLGNTVPKDILRKGLIDIIKPKDMKDAEWDKLTDDIQYYKEQLTHIVDIWGSGRGNGPLKSDERGGLDYKTAKEIVDAFQAQGYEFNHDSVELQKRWHLERFLENPNITANHLSLVESSLAWELVKVEKEDGSPKMKMLDRQSVEIALGEEHGDNSAKQKQLLKEYDKILEEMNAISGEYIEFVTEATFEKIENLSTSINSVYNMTKSMQKGFIQEYSELREKSGLSKQSLHEVESVLEELYEPLEKDQLETDRKRKTIESEEQLNKINEKIDSIIKSPPELINKDFLSTLEVLKQNLISEFSGETGTQGVISTSKIIKKVLEEKIYETGRLNDVTNSIVHDLQNYSHDLIASTGRKDRLLHRLRQLLVGSRFGSEMTQAKDLSELMILFGKNNTLGKAISQLEQSLVVWRNHYSETEYFEMQEKIAEQFNDYSTNYSEKQEDMSPSSLVNKYSKYSEGMKSDEFNTTLESFNESWYLWKNDKSPANEKLKIQSRKELQNAIIEAIKVKHEVFKELSEEELPENYKEERNNFNRFVFPQLLNQQIGREKIPTIRLLSGSEGQGLLEVRNVLVGKGLLSEFIKEMKDIGVDVHMMERTGVVGGRKVDINGLRNIERIIKNGKLQSESQTAFLNILKGSQEKQNPITDIFSDPVRILVSQNTSLLVGASQLKDGKLNKKFKEWYDSKIEFFEKESMDTELNNLKEIYGHYVVDKELTSVATKHDAKQIIRALYFDKLSSSQFNDLVGSARDSEQLKKLSGSFFKYVSIGEATGAKSRAGWDLLSEMRDMHAKGGIADKELLSPDQLQAINAYESKGKILNIVGIADEIKNTKGDIIGSLSAHSIVKSQLRDLKENKELVADQIKHIDNLLESLNSSAVNAQSYLGTMSAHLLYLHKGRRLEFGNNNRFGTAGLKPTAWFNKANESVLLKTNFVYDPVVADIMDKAGIDILTHESAAKSFNKEMVKVSEKEFNELDNKTSENAAAIAIRNATNANKSEISLENLFLGKIEDRKSLTSVSYAHTDFLSEIGYKSFSEDYVNYKNIINDSVSDLSRLVSGVDRLGTSYSLINKLKEENQLFEESSDGLTTAYIEAGVDPNQGLIHDSIKRIAIKNLMNKIRKPQSKGASYSILVPYIEGSVPLYKDINDIGKRTQVLVGGKKSAWEDGYGTNAIINDFSQMQYIVSSNQAVGGVLKRRDVVLGKDKQGNWKVTDPYKTLDSNDLKGEIKEIERMWKEIGSDPLFGYMHDKLMEFNKSERADILQTSVHLHSLSLRMPNLGGDVGTHKIEGFYTKEQGNIVGINVFDIAQIHQADFDVDALSSHHMKPRAFSEELYKGAGLSIEAHIYPSIGERLNFFGNGSSSLRAGSSSKDGDAFDVHNQLFMQSKKNFGVAKKLSTSISALIRQSENFSIGISDVLPEGAIGSDIVSPKNTDRAKIAKWLQVYKNTEQSIIDAAKEPNFASAANSKELVDYLLFGDKPSKYNLTVEQEIKFGNDNFKGFFDLSNIKGNRRETVKESIVEFIKAIGRPQRLLTDVFDEGGRRPPDADEVARIRSDYYDFIANPNKYVYDMLSFKNSLIQGKGRATKMSELNKLFFGRDFENFQQYKDYMKETNLKFLQPKNSLFFIKNKEAFRESTIAGKLISEFRQSKSELTGYTKSLTNNGQRAANAAEMLIQNLNIATSIQGVEGNKEIQSILEETGGVMSGTYLEGFYKSLSTKKEDFDVNKIQQYSLLFSALTNEKKSLQRFISKAGKNLTDSHYKAKKKLYHIENIVQHLENKEHEMLEHIYSNAADAKTKKLSDRFNIKRTVIDTQQRGGKYISNKDNKNPAYVYRKYTESGRIKFKEAGWIRAGGQEKFYNGEYYILKNPIRYEPMTTSEVIDGWSHLVATGDIQLSHLEFGKKMNEMNFIEDFTNLKRTLGSNIRDTFEFNKKNPHAIENWQLDRGMQDALVKVFMDKWIDKGRSSQSDMDNNQSLDLLKYMMKPEPVFNTMITGPNGIKLPKFKPNNTLVKALSRYMLQNGRNPEFNEIFGTIGREYRMRYDGIIPEIAELHKSKLYDKTDNFFNKEQDPMFTIAFDKGWLYGRDSFPSLKEHWSTTLDRMGSRTKSKIDENNNLQFLWKYGRYEKVINDLEFYTDPKRPEKLKTDCG